jgi:hypothetical protein
MRSKFPKAPESGKTWSTTKRSSQRKCARGSRVRQAGTMVFCGGVESEHLTAGRKQTGDVVPDCCACRPPPKRGGVHRRRAAEQPPIDRPCAPLDSVAQGGAGCHAASLETLPSDTKGGPKGGPSRPSAP